MQGYITNIEQVALDNEYYRQVLYTGHHSQLVVMSLSPNEDIGEETHDLDQFVVIVAGNGIAYLDGVGHTIMNGSAIVVPAGTLHNIKNTSSDESMKIYTVYSPAEHKDGTIHETKSQAMMHEEHFDGKTSE